MAEFCLDCLNKINGSNHNKHYFVLSKELELCEECGQWKHVVITRRQFYYPFTLGVLFFNILRTIVLFLWKWIARTYKFLRR